MRCELSLGNPCWLTVGFHSFASFLGLHPRLESNLVPLSIFKDHVLNFAQLLHDQLDPVRVDVAVHCQKSL